MTAAAEAREPVAEGLLGGDRRGLARMVLAVLAVLAVGGACASLAIGPVTIGLSDTVAVIAAQFGAEQPLSADQTRARVILLDIRAPRTVMGFLVGGALAVAGAVMQGLFRNPLADPGLVGISASASLAAVTTIVLGSGFLAYVLGTASVLALPVAAFFGALVGTVALYRISTRRGHTSTATMLLAGIAIAALAQAATGVLIFISDDQQLRDLTFWSLGSLGGATWDKAAIASVFLIPILLAAPLLGRGLNGLLLGEAEAMHIGVNVQAFKRAAVALVALAVGVSVAISGIIGFVGIVVPHLLRLLMGPDNTYLLPACALLGAGLLLAADIAARMVVIPAELPIGIVTALIGAPFFLWILLRQRSVLDV